MDEFKPRVRNNPEKKIQDAIQKFLELKGWLVKNTHGNAFQSGFPDLYAYHPDYKERWIEVKNPESYHFTKAQKVWFPKFSAFKCGIWILVAATEAEYDKLFKKPNWTYYCKDLRPRGLR